MQISSQFPDSPPKLEEISLLKRCVDAKDFNNCLVIQ